MTNIGNLFRSRKFVLALVFLIVTLFVSAVPTVAPHADNLMQIGAVIVGVALFGITAEDSFKAWAENRPANVEGALRSIIEEVLGEWFPDEEEPANPPIPDLPPDIGQPHSWHGSTTTTVNIPTSGQAKVTTTTNDGSVITVVDPAASPNPPVLTGDEVG